MNEFEKWLREKRYDLFEHTNDSWESGIFTGAKEAWGAALKMVKKQMEQEERHSHNEYFIDHQIKSLDT